MNLHEFQAKALLKSYRLPVASNAVAESAKQAWEATKKLGGRRWVVKTQVHAGGRGKAGGVKLVETKKAIDEFCKQHLGKRLVTYQTDKRGQPVNHILVEKCTDIERELYLSVVVDRSRRRVVCIASQEGGVEIEQVAAATPEKIHTLAIDPLLGPMPWQGRWLAEKLALDTGQTTTFVSLFIGLIRLFIDKDLSLIEINPLVVTTAGKLLCLDAKINLDANATYKHPKLAGLRDLAQEDERENRAHQWQLSYVALDGDIGCMVNGAGLAMGTMDTIKLHGGSPANFLDVGGGATAERVREAFRLILSDKKVKAVLINIFGGIVRCDLIAEGIKLAITKTKVRVPIVVRLVGNNAELGLSMLAKSGLNVRTEQDLTKAVKLAIKAAGKIGKTSINKSARQTPAANKATTRPSKSKSARPIKSVTGAKK